VAVTATDQTIARAATQSPHVEPVRPLTAFLLHVREARRCLLDVLGEIGHLLHLADFDHLVR
jgi:hypothetical protein